MIFLEKRCPKCKQVIRPPREKNASEGKNMRECEYCGIVFQIKNPNFWMFCNFIASIPFLLWVSGTEDEMVAMFYLPFISVGGWVLAFKYLFTLKIKD